MNEWQDAIAETWNKSKVAILTAAGVVSLVVGIVLFPIPFVPGWPFLVFGAYCLQVAAQESEEVEPA